MALAFLWQNKNQTKPTPYPDSHPQASIILKPEAQGLLFQTPTSYSKNLQHHPHTASQERGKGAVGEGHAPCH